MKRYITATILTAASSLAAWAGLVFDGTPQPPVTVIPPANTGLEAVYVLPTTQDVTIRYTASSATATVEWTRYSQLGGAYGEAMTFDRQGAECTLPAAAGDNGYVITDNGRQHCYWVTDYSAGHEMRLDDARVDPDESDCDMTAITIDGTAPRITYYTINGVPTELSRDITVSYNTLEWDEASMTYRQVPASKTLAYIQASTVRVTAPLCDTAFEITGDRFLEAWSRGIAVETPTYTATAIDVHTTATATERDNDNEMNDSGGDLGGSAPCEITFTAYVTDAVAYREWQVSRDSGFDVIDLRFNQDEVTHTFRDAGTTYVRYVAADASGRCEYVGDTYQINIGESRIDCPNAFSPSNQDGVNDEWKVSYKSIVQFECHIFNQWGIEMFSTTDPSRGWDGRHGGKLVPAGVYYYVIKARGADGRKYSLSGDINIIGYRKRATNTGNTEL